MKEIISTLETQISLFMTFNPQVRERLNQIGSMERVSYKSKKPSYPRDVIATTSQIIETVLEKCNVSLELLTSKKRDEYIARPRHIIFYLLKSNGLTFKAVGEMFNRDHSTVIYACNEHSDKTLHDEFYAKRYNQVVKELNLLNK